MRRFGDFLINSWPAAVMVTAGAIGIILFAIPGIHGAAWVIGLGLIAVCAVCLLGFAQMWLSAQERIDRLNAELSQAYSSIGGVTLTDLEQSHPNPDAAAADRIRILFPQDAGLIQNLRISSCSNLDITTLEPLDTFLREFEHASFFDSASHFAFMKLFRTGRAVRSWVLEETVGQDDGLLVVTPGDSRPGGWHEYSEAGARGDALAGAFVAARFEFERAVREGGIINPS